MILTDRKTDWPTLAFLELLSQLKILTKITTDRRVSTCLSQPIFLFVVVLYQVILNYEIILALTKNKNNVLCHSSLPMIRLPPNTGDIILPEIMLVVGNSLSFTILLFIDCLIVLSQVINKLSFTPFFTLQNWK